MKILIKLIFTATALLAATSCTTKVDGLFVSEAFTHSELQRTGLLVGGVVVAGADYNGETSSGYANILASQIRDERKDFKVALYDQFASALGKKDLATVMDEFRTTGSLNPPTKKMLAEKLKGQRFLVLSRIDGNFVNETSRTDQATERKDSRGRIERTPGQTHLLTERKVTALMSIFDLQKGELAFSGTVTKGVTNQESYTEDTSRPVVSININSQSGNRRHPSAPDTRDVLTRVYHGFVENFPEEG